MRKTEINLTCGDCLYFNDLIHPSEHFTCKLAGYLEYNKPCSNFCFNMHSKTVVNNQDKEFLAFIRKVPTYKLNELAALLVQEGYNRNRGWSLGDFGYIKLERFEDTIAAYVQVVFKSFAGNQNDVLVDGVGTNQNWLGVFDQSSLMNEKEWRVKHKQLLLEGKFYPEKTRELEEMFPGYKYPSKEEMSKEDYIPMNVFNFIRNQK